MKVRYCMTVLDKLYPCVVGYGGTGDAEDCFDEPMKEHCRNIVDTEQLPCPYCDSNLGHREEHFFGDNIRDAIKIIAGNRKEALRELGKH